MSTETLDTPETHSVPSALPALRWRTLLTAPLCGVRNMAWDMALMARARSTGEAVIRVYSWSAPTLSFGRNQKTAGYDRARIREAGMDVVRRPTGGRAILHHREITYSVTAPVSETEPVTVAYDWINTLLLAALRALGVAAEIAPRTVRTPAPDEHPCFSAASAGEITARGRKLVGSAQYREAGAMLQHGSILTADDQASLAALSGHYAPPPATLGQLLGRAPTPADMCAAVRDAFGERGIDAVQLSAEELAPSVSRYTPTFEDPQWTWRR